MSDARIIASAPLANGRRVLERRRLHTAPVVAIEEAIAPSRSADAAAAEAVARTKEIADAVDEARARMRAESDAALEEAKAQARETAHAEGLALGRQEGREEVLSEEREARGRLAAVLDAVEATHERLLELTVENAVAVGFAAACKILGEKLVTGEGMRAAIDEVLRHARHTEGAVVRLHPSDLRRIEALGGEPTSTRTALQADESIPPGGCSVDTTAGTLEARLDARMSAMRDALLAAHAESRS